MVKGADMPKSISSYSYIVRLSDHSLVPRRVVNFLERREVNHGSACFEAFGHLKIFVLNTSALHRCRFGSYIHRVIDCKKHGVLGCLITARRSRDCTAYNLQFTITILLVHASMHIVNPVHLKTTLGWGLYVTGNWSSCEQDYWLWVWLRARSTVAQVNISRMWRTLKNSRANELG